MMTMIGIISDVHASPEPVAEAISVFDKAGVDQILCAGDIAGYMDDLDQTIDLLIENDCMCIIGNHDQQCIERYADQDNRNMKFLKNLPTTYQDEIAGKSLYMVHAQPPDICHGGIKLLDKAGQLVTEYTDHWQSELQSFDHDILIVGHTHQVYAQTLADTLVINPGSTIFNHCCAILHLPAMQVEWIALSGEMISTTWNWSEHVIYGK